MAEEYPWLTLSYDIHRMHQLYMVYYYTSLAIRENILQVNGSNIKDWWLYHHYLSILLALLLVLWPSTELSKEFMIKSCYMMLWQGCIMILQNYYQARRHYVRTALGKAKEIDPSSTETIVEKPVDLQVLVPLLFFTYVSSLYSHQMFRKISHFSFFEIWG